VCPVWQRLVNGVSDSNLFLLGKNALIFDLSGVETRSKHGIFKSRYQLGEFHRLCNELTKYSTKFEYCRMLPSTFDCTYMTAHFTQLKKFSESNIRGKKTVCDMEVNPTSFTFNALFFQFRDEASLVHPEDRYVCNDSYKYIGR
jgi:hypothetical protein